MKYTQRDKQKRGESFEREFREAANYIDCWIMKIQTTLSGTPFDFILLTEKFNFAVELKRIQDNRLPYSSIRPNQRTGLTKFEKLKNGRSVIVCNIKNDKENSTYIIPWKEIWNEVCSGKSGSIEVKKYKEIPRRSVKGKLLLDLKALQEVR